MRHRWWGRWRTLLGRLDPVRILGSHRGTPHALVDASDASTVHVDDGGLITDGLLSLPVSSHTDRSPAPFDRRQTTLGGRALLLRRQLTATCAKDLAAPASNEDALIVRLGQNRAAVFDGATESFAARRWSRLLASYWGRDLEEDWVGLARRDYAQHVDSLTLSWAQEAAVQRGSYATIAAAEAQHDLLDITIVGDSCAFLLEADAILWSHPFTTDEQFTSAPEALGTRQDLAAADAEALAAAHTLIDPGTLNATHLMLATDALSAWLLTPDGDERRRRLRDLFQCRSPGQFESVVAEERHRGHLKVDDCTVVVLALDGPR